MSECIKLIVDFYKTEAGNEPVREWLKALNKEDKLIIGSDIIVVQTGYPFVGMPLVKPLGKGLYEIRSNLSQKRTSRVIYFVENGQLSLLHSFIKKTQKTPQEDLDLAYKRYKTIRGTNK
jgi:phage-related protein